MKERIYVTVQPGNKLSAKHTVKFQSSYESIHLGGIKYEY